MELKQHLSTLRWGRAWIIWGTLLILAVTLTVSWFTPVSYTTSIAFSVNRIAIEETEYYEYDGYYAIQAADLYSQTIVSWFLTPSVILTVYEKAGVIPEIDSLRAFTSRFKTKKYSPQNIVVTYTERDERAARKLADAIVDTVETNAGELNQTAGREALFEVRGSTPVVVENRVNWVLNLGVGLIAGLLVSITIVYIARYLRS
jgi:capsular polysaccharide biosynthesis protein